ncbi:MAG: DUF3592 domain-containing protein [bacterium]
MSLNKGALFLILFGTVFLGIGVGAGFFSIRTLMRAEAMRLWQETPAQVVTCELSVSHGSKGGSSYQAKATYQYQVNGVRYTGDRVSLHAGSDNIGQFHRRVYAELKRCMDRKEMTACWVNPENFADVILIRKPRPEMLIFLQVFVLAFGGIGLAIVMSGLAQLLPVMRAEPSSGQGQIRMRGASAHQIAGVLALAWNGYVGCFLWKAFHVMAPEPLPWYLWLLAATGVIPAVVAGYLVGRFRKFGVSVFEMSPLPGVLGGPVSGTVRIPAKVETEDGFGVVLQCVHQYTTGSGKHSKTHRDVMWEDSRHIAGSLSYGEETMVPVRFAIPYNEAATTAAGGGKGYYWRLAVTAAAPGIDYKAVFDVPVQRTAQSSPTFVPQRMPDSAVSQERVEALIARVGLHLAPQSDGGFELTFPAARALPSSLILLLFVTGWSGVCYAMWTVAKAPVFLAAVFTLIDGVMVMILLNMLLVARGIVVDRARRECVVWKRLLGFPKRERRIPFDAVADVASGRSGQSGNTVTYGIVLCVGGRGPVEVGAGIGLWRDAEGIVKLLQAAMTPNFHLEGFLV